MDKFIAVVFDTETKAFEGRQALLDLHRDGDVVLYAAAVIVKNLDGQFTIKDVDSEGPIGLAFGVILGGLVGSLAGPAGLVAGSLGGGAIGTIRDLTVGGIGSDVIDQVGLELKPGKAALIADLTEGWATPLDVRMSELGGTIYRRAAADVIDEMIDRDIKAVSDDLDELQAEWKEAKDDAKANLKAKIDKAKANMKAAETRIEERFDAFKKETDARIEALKSQIKTAKAESKVKFEKRIEEIKADYARRSDLLKQASSLAKQALAA